jgi:flagellar L-ring protein precursor FlgH
MPRVTHVLTLAMLLITCCIQTHAQSLWQRRNERFALFFVDTRAHDPGDILTVLISENTDVTKQDQRELDKSSDADFNFNFAGASSGGAASSASVNMAGDSSRAFDGSSRYRVAQEFSDRISVQVMEVLPNGHLVVEGRRRRIIADEQRELRVSGIVRPIDIMPDNTVRSQFVANLNIQYIACGPESHFTNQGWAARALNRIWPF